MNRPRAHRRPRSHERGIVLIFCLIILVVLLAGGVAVMRSMNTSLTSSGNLAFRRDLVNQGEQAVSTVLNAFTAGALTASTATANNIPGSNYSAVQLQTNERGVPLVLLDATSPYTGKDMLNADFTLGVDSIAGATPDVVIRYVIDRLCNNAGLGTALGQAGCVRDANQVRGGTVTSAAPPLPPTPLVYRLTVRVDGPRDTQVFLQTSFTKPE